MQVAALYDNTKNFINSEPSMMKLLAKSWKGSLGGSSSAKQSKVAYNSQSPHPSRSSDPQQRHAVTGGDRSAVIKMPASWSLIRVSGGSLIAEGDRGEMVMMGLIYQNIINPQNPRASQLISGPMASREPKVICPLSANLFSDYVRAFNQTRRNNGKAQGSFQYVSTLPQPAGSQGAGMPIVAMFTVNFHDGMGLRNGSVWISLMAPFNAQAESWAFEASMSNIPEKYGSGIDPTLKAVVASYSQDARVVASEGAADLGRIEKQGEANRAQTQAIDARREASQKSYEDHRQEMNARDRVNSNQSNEHHDAEIDWQSKINQDYILDRSVIRDPGDNVHALVTNDLADALVKSNPNQVEIVPNQQLIRGRDFWAYAV